MSIYNDSRLKNLGVLMGARDEEELVKMPYAEREGFPGGLLGIDNTKATERSDEFRIALGSKKK